jgi:hypothetical protein
MLILDCKTGYHNNFTVADGKRTYFAGVPKYIEIGEHQYVEASVAHLWRASMLLGWYGPLLSLTNYYS